MEKMYYGANPPDRNHGHGNPMGPYRPPYSMQQPALRPIYPHAIRGSNMAYNMHNGMGNMRLQQPQPPLRHVLQQEVLLSPFVEPTHPIMQDSRMSEFFSLLLQSIELILTPGSTEPRQIGFRLVGCSCSHIDPVSRATMVGFVYRPASISEFCNNLSVFYIHLVADRCPNAQPNDLRKKFSLCYTRKDAGLEVLREFCDAYFRELGLVNAAGVGVISDVEGIKRWRSMMFSQVPVIEVPTRCRRPSRSPLPSVLETLPRHSDVVAIEEDNEEALSIQRAVASAFQTVSPPKIPARENGIKHDTLYEKAKQPTPTAINTVDMKDENRIRPDTDDDIPINAWHKKLSSPPPQASSPTPPQNSNPSPPPPKALPPSPLQPFNPPHPQPFNPPLSPPPPTPTPPPPKPSNPFHMPLSLTGPMASVNSEFFSPLLLSIVRSTELFQLPTRTLGIRCTYCRTNTEISSDIPSPTFLTLDRISRMGPDLYHFFLYHHVEVCGDIPGNLVSYVKASRPGLYSDTFYKERALLQQYCDYVVDDLGLEDKDGMSGVVLPRGGPGSAVMELERTNGLKRPIDAEVTL